MPTNSRASSLAPRAIDSITTIPELRAGGLSDRTIMTRCRPGGSWRKLLPGVVLLASGEPTRSQLLRAAARYLAPHGVLTGADALVAHGIDVPLPRLVHALAPSEWRRLPPDVLHVERSRRLPRPVVVSGLPYAGPARATLDAARRERDEDRLRDLLALPVFYGLCTYDQLLAELDAGNQRGSSFVRAKLRELNRTRQTYVHGVARELLRRAPLPPPSWDVTLCDSRGAPLGVVDAWWDEVGLGWQFNEQARQKKARELDRLALLAAGVVVITASPGKLTHDRERVVRELVSGFHLAARRPRPPVRLDVAGIAA